VTKTGVFVNEELATITAIIDDVGLDCVQLHGDEPAAMAAALLRRIPVVRAYHYGRQGMVPLANYLSWCQNYDCVPDALLVEGDSPAEYGGTGCLADWTRLARDRGVLADIPFILAGGLTPDNVTAAIETVRPDGVDVASGVESAPGRKNAALVRHFIAAAREAFSRL
jgi:phosphoribosylanthranilate isomerase